jgi:hypothetical protein
MAIMVDRGVTHAWSDVARSAWAFALIAIGFAGVITIVVGFNGISPETLGAIGGGEGGRTPTVAMFIAVYTGALIVNVGLAEYLEHRYGIKTDRSIMVNGGATFALAAIGRPWWLFATIRRLGWFAAIKSDAAMRAVLGVIGAGLVIGGFLSS